MTGFRRRSTGFQFSILLFATGAIVLATMGGILLTREWTHAQREFVRETVAVADLVGAGGASSVAARDTAAAVSVLTALTARSEVASAAFYAGQDGLLASYERAGESPPRTTLALIAGHSFSGERLRVVRNLTLAGETVGTVVLHVETTALTARRQAYQAQIGLVFLGTLVLSALLGFLFQRVLAGPLRNFVETVHRTVSDRKTDARVEGTGNPEIGSLSRAINDLLDRLGRRDRAMEQLRGQVRERDDRIQLERTKRGEARDALEKSEDQLRHSQRMQTIGVLAGGVAHDFNNILTAIIGYAQLLMLRLPEGSSESGSAREIARAGERAASLTKRLLVLSRKDGGENRVVDVNETMGGMEKMLGRVLGEVVDLHGLLDPNTWSVRCDPSQLEQVVLNLAVNARDAMPEGGTLTLATRNVTVEAEAARDGLLPDEYVLITARDTGCGMTREVLDRIFEPFYTTKESGKGTGMGLATVYGIVKQCGGHVEVDSKPDEGTEFRVFLPRCRQDSGIASMDPEGSVSRGTEKILLVDDDKSVLAATGKMLRSHGYQVVEAVSGDAALRVCCEAGTSLDLILSDVVMPGMSGCELRELATALVPGVPVLFMSGHTQDVLVRTGVGKTGIPVVAKPFRAEELTAEIRRTLDGEARRAA